MCGKETPDRATFCPACGTNLTSWRKSPASALRTDREARTKPNEEERTVKSRVQTRHRLSILVGYCITLAVFGCCGVVFAVRQGWISSPQISSFFGSSSSDLSVLSATAEESYLRGKQYLDSSSYSKALESFQTATRTYASYSDAWNGEGVALRYLDRAEEALVCYQTAVQVDPHNCSAWINEGQVLESLARYDEAMSCYNMALQNEPGNETAAQGKEKLLVRGIPENATPPPAKRYDDAHPLQVSGGAVEGSVLAIHVKAGEAFRAGLAVEGGQPPYYWYLVGSEGIADSVSFVSRNKDASVVAACGIGAHIDNPTSTARMARVNFRVEDSSQPTRRSEPLFSYFYMTVDNTDDSAIATRVAREWYQGDYGTVEGILQKAVGGLGSATATASYASPIRQADGHYLVTVTVTMDIRTADFSVRLSMPCILTIDTESAKVASFAYGQVQSSYSY
jgi:tetratricopeptide (TPR) repeat protein